jgi:thiamine biosynthesis lipoprotein
MKINQQLKMFSNWFYLIGLLFIIGCSPTDQTAKAREVLLQGKTMGSTYNIKLIVKGETIDTQAIHQDIDKLLKEINQQLSTYIPNSELSRFNRHLSTDPVSISPEFQFILSEAIRLGKLTEGKLDVTIGALVNLWGFGPQYRPEIVPSDVEIATARATVGLDKLSLVGDQLSKTVPELYVDLSTIAKGYAVDKVGDLIQQQGVANYMVEVGGEMRVQGFKHDGTLWHVAIEKPVVGRRAVQQIIVLGDNALASAGDYRNYFEVDGIRYSHIIDPDSAKPIQHNLVSVTVIHPVSMTADGLSTSMMLMGPEKALAFAKQHKLAAFFITKTEDGFEQQNTVEFTKFLK